MMHSDFLGYILTFIFSGAFVGFIQYLINRNDTRNDRFKTLQNEFQAGLDLRESTGKARYDEHAEAIKELRDIMTQLASTTAEQQKLLDANAALLVGLAQDKLVYLTDKCQKRGAITLKEKAILTAIYEPYHDKLNGNGHGKTGYEFAMNLPVVSDIEAEQMDNK